MAGIKEGKLMTIETDDEVTITIDFDEAMQAIAYLSDLYDYLVEKGYEKDGGHHIRTAKEICEAFCCEHFQNELEDG